MQYIHAPTHACIAYMYREGLHTYILLLTHTCMANVCALSALSLSLSLSVTSSPTWRSRSPWEKNSATIACVHCTWISHFLQGLERSAACNSVCNASSRRPVSILVKSNLPSVSVPASSYSLKKKRGKSQSPSLSTILSHLGEYFFCCWEFMPWGGAWDRRGETFLWWGRGPSSTAAAPPCAWGRSPVCVCVVCVYRYIHTYIETSRSGASMSSCVYVRVCMFVCVCLSYARESALLSLCKRVCACMSYASLQYSSTHAVNA